MDENEHHEKVVQFWSHVFKSGTALFNTPGDTLRSFLQTVLSTKLISDIECFVGEDADEDFPFPMTVWLIENVFKIAVTCEDKQEEKFFIDAIVILLEATYDRSVYEYVELTKLLIDVIDKLSSAKFKTPFCLINGLNRCLPNVVIPPVPFLLENERHRLRSLEVLFRTLLATSGLFLSHKSWGTQSVAVHLLNRMRTIFEAPKSEIIFLTLPLLKLVVPESAETNFELREVLDFITLRLVPFVRVIGVNPDVRENFRSTLFRLRTHVRPLPCIKMLMEVRKNSCMEDFIYNQIGYFLTKVPSNVAEELLKDFKDSPLNDKIQLLEELIASDLEKSLDHNQFNGTVSVRNISRLWNELLPSITEIASHSTVTYGRIKTIHSVLTTVFYIVGRIYKNRNDLTLQFFDDSLPVMLKCVAVHLRDTLHNDCLQAAVECLPLLLNLPEVVSIGTLDVGEVVEGISALIRSKNNGSDIFLPVPVVPKAKLYQSLQNVPLGISPATCMVLFTSAMASIGSDPDAAMQVLKSAPFLCFSKKVSPAQVIVEIILPAILCEREDLKLTALEIASLVASTEEVSIMCSTCLSKKYSGSEKKCSQIESHLLKLIDHSLNSSLSLRVQLLSVLPNLSRHMETLRGVRIVHKLVALLRDPEIEVRREVASLITTIIFGQKSVDEADRSFFNPKTVFQTDRGACPSAFALKLVLSVLEEEIREKIPELWGENLHCLLTTVSNIVSFPVQEALLPGLKLLLQFTGNCPISLSSITSQVAVQHKTSSIVLYNKFRPELSQVFGEVVVSNYIRLKISVAQTLAGLSEFFNDLSKSRFVSGSEPYLLSVLIAQAAKQQNLESLIGEYAEFVEQPLPVIITRCFQHIYVHIWLTESVATFEKAMSITCDLTSLSEANLVTHCQKSIIHHLLLNYHCDETRVLEGLRRVLDISSASNTKEIIACSLESRFVGYLLFLVGKFTKEDSARSEKIKSLESLTAVLPLMGRRRVTPVARKVLATLQTTLGLDGEGHHSLQCKAWNSFVRNVDSREIAPMLATIVISVLSLLNHAEAEVAQILNYLLVEQRPYMEGYIESIIFLPEHPALVKILSSLRMDISLNLLDIKERLVRETALALHETVGVRLEGLKALLVTLRKFPDEVQTLINGSDTPASCVTALWEALLVCCRDTEEAIAMTAASCLGELGAVDPALLPRKLRPPNKLPLTVHDPEFAYLALRDIVRGFQTARTSTDMDAFALGIQELLKIYNITEGEDNEIWMRFSAAERSLMRPMLSSRYKVVLPVRSEWPEIIFGGPDATSHVSWASLWVSKLIYHCSDDKAVIIFRACEPSIRRDPKVLQFFLQFILLHILIQDSAHHSIILNEIMAVLTWSGPQATTEDSPVPIRLIEYCGYPSIRSTLSETDAHDCAMTVFLIIDFLQYWIRLYRAKHFAVADHLNQKDYTAVLDFLSKIDFSEIASSNFKKQEYARAIQIWEDLARNNNDILFQNLPKLSKAYARFGDLDSVAGAGVLRGSTLAIEDQIFYHQVSKQIEEARILFEQLGIRGNLTPTQIEGLVLCYLRLGEPATAHSHILKYVNSSPEMPIILSEAYAECLLKLSDWKALESYLKSDIAVGEKNWYTQLSRIALDLRENSSERVITHITETRSALVENFASLRRHAGPDNHGYQCMVKLHILNDIEKVHDLLCKEADVALETPIFRLFKDWNAKEALMQSDNEYHEQILGMRRILLSIMSYRLPEEVRKVVNVELGKCWVKSAQAARVAGCLHQAYNYILCAEQYAIPQTFIEKAQLLWVKGLKEESLLTLTRGISSHFPDAESVKDLPGNVLLEQRKMIAEAKLLYAIYNEETSNCSSFDNMANYQAAYEACRQLEKTQVLLAQCLDRGLSFLDEKEHGEGKACDLRVMMVCHFGKSLTNGCEYIYQSVPRMLSIWLDLGENKISERRVEALKKINRQIQIYTERFPPFVFMTALPQLLSRIVHPDREVFLLMKAILVKLILAFPQQCLWAIQTIAKSSVPERTVRYKEIINDPSLRAPKVLKLIEDFTQLVEKLNRLTNVNLPQDSVTKGLLVSNVVRELPVLLESQTFSRIIPPITKFCSIALPKSVSSTTHQPFPKDPVTISGIKKEVQVLPSLQKPRKITFIGSDGKPIIILCKPKDDLRRDARLMEFNNIVNMYLHRDPDSRARNLHIRTYVVTPLGECGGLLEWVSNLVGLRPALLQIYREHGKFVSTRELRKLEPSVRDSLEKKRCVFLEKLVPMHPPLFYEWFRITFPDLSGWYAARQAYTRTTAVLSMVGYILGLGDRHGENILFDSESGDTVHVDFNCLFNKGENFDWKERVPFRLTHNMTNAMGPCGLEGTFRKSCEISMRVLRAKGKTLMSVLTPFAYDPSGSWSKNKEIGHKERDQKIAEALEELSDIEKRLNGSMRINQKNNTFYLSVEGLVKALIAEATSVDNLCQMYLGWGAYL